MKISWAILILFLVSCNHHRDDWKGTWRQNNVQFKQVVDLLKADHLKKVYGRVGYAIPDSMGLDKVCGGIVFQETDWTYDSTYSILFRINFDSSKAGRISYPVFIYTNNSKRIKEYESQRVRKIQANWYFQHRG